VSIIKATTTAANDDVADILAAQGETPERIAEYLGKPAPKAKRTRPKPKADDPDASHLEPAIVNAEVVTPPDESDEPDES
jgi:hypothetical protein